MKTYVKVWYLTSYNTKSFVGREPRCLETHGVMYASVCQETYRQTERQRKSFLYLTDLYGTLASPLRGH